MSLYAELDADKRVLRVVVCESLEWVQNTLGGTWVETSETTATVQGGGPGLYDTDTIAPRRFIPPWQQPFGAGDPTIPMNGDWRWHNGRAWRSLTDANAWEPGVSSWREMLTEWPDWVQPTGSTDAYQVGEKMTFNGQHYTSAINANVWSPATYAAGWTLALAPDASLLTRTYQAVKNTLVGAARATGISRPPASTAL